MGCDSMSKPLVRDGLNFNPRIPYGMRHVRSFAWQTQTVFQSTHPVWDATYLMPRSPMLFKFQSTHPVWDATVTAEPTAFATPISIHASRMGCDGARGTICHRHRNFNPRIPYGMRLTVSVRTCAARPYFNPRIPYGMRPAHHAIRLGGLTISIHASRMGCDTATRRCVGLFNNFNPRIPYGMRPRSRCRSSPCWTFQSTHPVWDATQRVRLQRLGGEFQSTHPVWDATRMRHGVNVPRPYFNPRIPYGMRQDAWGTKPIIYIFQSTHPVWDATQLRCTMIDVM